MKSTILKLILVESKSCHHEFQLKSSDIYFLFYCNCNHYWFVLFCFDERGSMNFAPFDLSKRPLQHFLPSLANHTGTKKRPIPREIRRDHVLSNRCHVTAPLSARESVTPHPSLPDHPPLPPVTPPPHMTLSDRDTFFSPPLPCSLNGM
ncbi:hypothetical protein HNY73_001372 [Argiope bruennichi]|uniref:Uncharacterized protein n=1 Tax=Argiope bruennichi TaxID=94029 RepID=A0A8T0G1G7_ARGBR|nr:hypothetical protein HNY73_001372 [Argiope bruennichi]